MEGVTTIAQLLSMVDDFKLQWSYAHKMKYVSYYFERSKLLTHEDIEGKP